LPGAARMRAGAGTTVRSEKMVFQANGRRLLAGRPGCGLTLRGEITRTG
jgi:hypothetical protein